MPKRKDIKKILVIGAGPIIIGQACEFDYSGTQACKALKDESYKVILINSNPATIMTDPDVADKTYIEPISLEVLEEVIKKDIPLFGICLGHQILALALDAKTKKMKLGHRGANHPVKNLITKKVEITSQNHGFEVVKESLKKNTEITHLSLFDNSIEGIRLKNKPVFSVQYHPEANPGPQDSKYLFSNFIKDIKKYAKKKRY